MKGSAARRIKSQSTGLTSLKRLIQKVERNLNAKIDRLRGELEASELALAAAKLRVLNEHQAEEGVARLRTNLRSLHKAGIIDQQGRRIRSELPSEMTDRASDVV
jgi:hypothetical protein